MTLHYSTTVRNAELDAKETAIGTAPLLRLYDGSIPANCAASATNKLAEGALPSDWLSDAASGAKSKAGTWTMTGQAAAGSGTVATYYRIYDSGGSTCHEQGSVTATGGGGDMTVDNTSVANAQVVTVSSYTTTAGNT